jgi:hypothetical protein
MVLDSLTQGFGSAALATLVALIPLGVLAAIYAWRLLRVPALDSPDLTPAREMASCRALLDMVRARRSTALLWKGAAGHVLPAHVWAALAEQHLTELLALAEEVSETPEWYAGAGVSLSEDAAESLSHYADRLAELVGRLRSALAASGAPRARPADAAGEE